MSLPETRKRTGKNREGKNQNGILKTGAQILALPMKGLSDERIRGMGMQWSMQIYPKGKA